MLATLAGPLVIAVSFHFLLALPDGRLGRPGRRLVGGPRLRRAVGTGIGLAVAGPAVPARWRARLIWPLAVLCALPATRLRYLKAAGRDKERMQWLGTGLLVAATVALVSAVLHLLVGWPESAGAVAASASAAVPLAVIAGANGRRWRGTAAGAGARAVGRGSRPPWWRSSTWSSCSASGRRPATTPTGGSSACPWSRPPLAAIGYLPVRDRLVASATRFVYGAREAPDEALRTFGSRLTRAVSMDELLLQLAESLRKTMRLTAPRSTPARARCWSARCRCPDAGGKSIVLTDRERPVVARAGVSGNAWASVWLPALLDGREQAQLRVAPISHAGELLGLIVVERAARPTPSPRRTTAC